MQTLKLMPWNLSVAQLPAGSSYDWALASPFYSISQTPDELSVICETILVPSKVKQQDGWRALRIEGILEFSLIGILARLSGILAAAGISIFAISTYNTDYILVQEADVDQALETLKQNGYTILS